MFKQGLRETNNWNSNITLCANKNCDRFGSSAHRFCLSSSTFLHFWHEETKITRRGLKTGCSPTWFNCPHHLYTYVTYVLHLHEQAGPRKKRWSHPHPSALLQCSSQRHIEINVPTGTETIKIKIKSKLFIFFPNESDEDKLSSASSRWLPAHCIFRPCAVPALVPRLCQQGLNMTLPKACHNTQARTCVSHHVMSCSTMHSIMWPHLRESKCLCCGTVPLR